MTKEVPLPCGEIESRPLETQTLDREATLAVPSFELSSRDDVDCVGVVVPGDVTHRRIDVDPEARRAIDLGGDPRRGH